MGYSITRAIFESSGAYLEDRRARAVYRRLEVEYPVDFIMNVAARRGQAASGYVAKEIADWAKYKFGVGL